MRARLLITCCVMTASLRVQASPVADVVVAWAPAPLGKLGDTIADAASRAGASYIDASVPIAPLPDPRPLVRRGITAYGNLELEAALAALDAAAELVDRTGAAQLDAALLVDLFLYRALTHAQRADDGRAWADLVVAAGIEPTRVLDPAGFPPRVIERFAQAVAHVAAAPRGRVTLVGAHCEVRIDGASVTTPEVELPFGRHWLAVTCEARAPIRTRFTVDRPVRELVLAGAPIVPPSDAELLVQARTASARALVVVTSRGGTAVVRRLGIDGKERDRVSLAIARGDREIAAAVTRMLAPPSVPVAAPWYRSRWLWAAGGAAIASAILLPLALDRGGEVPKVLVRPGGIPSW
ncbi:MAG: hypothetical protein WKG01_00680 [Kofleriaceae bacterium]